MTLGRPVGRQPGHVVQEALQDGLTVVGVGDLGVELDTGQWSRLVHEGRDRVAVVATTSQPSGARTTASPCDIHTDSLCGLSGEQHRLGGPHNSPPVLSQAGLVDLSTEGRSHDLESVADAEHGDPGAGIASSKPGRRECTHPEGPPERMRYCGPLGRIWR